MQEEFWISELADRTNVSTRTIRYYIEEGLLPQPEVRGKYAVFTTEYLHRLRLIKILKDSYLPLKEIKGLLDTLNSGQINELLDRFDADPTEAISSLKILPTHSQVSMVKESALEYITRLRQHTESPQASRKANPQTTSINDLKPVQKARKETWQRIELAPGVELHVRQPLPSESQHLVDLIIEVSHH